MGRRDEHSREQLREMAFQAAEQTTAVEGVGSAATCEVVDDLIDTRSHRPFLLNRTV